MKQLAAGKHNGVAIVPPPGTKLKTKIGDKTLSNEKTETASAVGHELQVINFLPGDFVKFKIGCIMHYGMIDEKNEDGSYEVSYTSKKIFNNTINRFGIVNLPHKLEAFGTEYATNLTKIEGMKNWNEY